MEDFEFDCSKLWVTSDLHLGHENVIKFNDRPFTSIDEMDATLISNWNSVVKPDDTVLLLGDLFLGNPNRIKSIMLELNGIVHLARGNHDKKWLRQKGLASYFASVCTLAEIRVFDKMTEKEQPITLCHYALRSWNQSHYGAWNLHGHSHGSLPPIGKQMDVSVDACAQRAAQAQVFINADGQFKPEYYRPISYAEIRDFMETRTFQKVDHHEERP